MNMSKVNMIEEQDTVINPENEEEEVFIDDGSIEELDYNNLMSEEVLDKDLKELIEASEQDETIEQQLDSLFEELQIDGVVDIAKEKGKILLLLQAYLSRVSGLNKEKAKSLLKSREKAINKHIVDLDSYFRNHVSSFKSRGKGVFSKIKNRFSNMGKQAKNDFRNVVKRFAVYEVYQVMSPKRIAGESKLTNFIHNMIMGGIKLAMKYPGGKEKDLKRYDKKFLLKLQKLHNQLSRQKSEINLSEITAPTTPIGKAIDKQKTKGIGY